MKLASRCYLSARENLSLFALLLRLYHLDRPCRGISAKCARDEPRPHRRRNMPGCGPADAQASRDVAEASTLEKPARSRLSPFRRACRRPRSSPRQFALPRQDGHAPAPHRMEKFGHGGPAARTSPMERATPADRCRLIVDQGVPIAAPDEHFSSTFGAAGVAYGAHRVRHHVRDRFRRRSSSGRARGQL